MMRKMLLVLLTLLPALAWAVDPLPFASEAERERFHALTAELRCVMCQNQSLADSEAVIARDMRREVFELMQGGKSDDEIKAYLTERYGDFVLYRPPLDGRTWWIWFAPAALAVVALLTVALIVRRRRRDASAVAPRAVEDEEW